MPGQGTAPEKKSDNGSGGSFDHVDKLNTDREIDRPVSTTGGFHFSNSYVGPQSHNGGSRNELLVNGAEQAIDQMKYEIANEFGVKLGADTTSRANESVGGEITKRLVQMAEQQLGGRRF